MNTSIRIAYFAAVYCLGLLYPNQAVLSAMTSFAVVIGVAFFLQDRWALKRATYYVRPERKSGVFDSLKGLVLALTLGFGCYYLHQLLPEEVRKKDLSLYVILVAFSMMLADHYRHFTASIRSFDFGLVLPGRRHDKVHWRSISRMDLHDNCMTIAIDGRDAFVFKVDQRDLEDALNIRNQFEQRTGL